MDGPRDYHTKIIILISLTCEVSQRQILYDITYMWNLKKKKKVQMNLFRKQTQRHRTQTHGYQRIYIYPIAAVTNYHKFNGLGARIYSTTVLEVRSPKQSLGANIKVLGGLAPSRSSIAVSIPCLVQLLEAANILSIPWICTGNMLPSLLLSSYHHALSS